MNINGTCRFFLLAFLLSTLLITSACGPASTAAPASTEVPQPTATQAQAAATLPPPPTATSTTAPSPTLPPTETPVPPTATPQPSATPTLGLAQDGLSAWCLPENTAYTSKTVSSINAPENARIGSVKDGALEVNNLPASVCAFLYTFNQPAPTGLKLELYDATQGKPWLVADLLPVEGSPETAAAILRHGYIIAPPVWNISFTFAVRDANGSELRRDQVNLHRWTPKMCWNGQYPNVYTQRCPLPQDLHPWDPSYRTPMPTFAPGEDPSKGW